MPTVVEALFEDLRAILLKPDQAAGIFPSAKVRWRPARTGGGPGGHSWLRYLQCHVFARPDFATGGPHGGAPRGPLAGGLHGGGAPHFAMGGTASRRRALTEPRCASERGLAMGGGRPAGAASRWEAAANPWLGAIARCSRTGSSNPSPSSRQSVSRRISPSCIARPAVAAAWAGPARRHGRQRRAELVNITPIAGNVSVGPYSSTAVPARRFTTVVALVRPSEVGLAI
jgi:hypothetical protein